MKAFAGRACVNGLAVAMAGLALTSHGVSHAAASPLGSFTSAESDYLEQCGGCHGLQGDSTPSPIPVLRNRVGYFMCTDAGREYLARLPNIAYARVDDDALAQLLNFVVFGLGGGTAPAKAKPFDAVEVGRLRARPMTGSAVDDTRKPVVEKILHTCAAPASLRQAYAIHSVDVR